MNKECARRRWTRQSFISKSSERSSSTERALFSFHSFISWFQFKEKSVSAKKRKLSSKYFLENLLFHRQISCVSPTRRALAFTGIIHCIRRTCHYDLVKAFQSKISRLILTFDCDRCWMEGWLERLIFFVRLRTAKIRSCWRELSRNERRPDSTNDSLYAIRTYSVFN